MKIDIRGRIAAASRAMDCIVQEAKHTAKVSAMSKYLDELDKLGVSDEVVDTIETLADRRIRLRNFGAKVYFFNPTGDAVQMFSEEDLDIYSAAAISDYSMHLTKEMFNPFQ